VRDEDVGDAIDAVVAEVVQDVAGTEVDEDGLATVAKQVDVGGVRVTNDIFGHLH
jgi:hypothetical protein